ncbi:MAG: cobyrinate a,c-diamide synthase [Nocardioidaceae bacterium]|nr:cobyrinate a,c-diamide synthase [Nocardioidaceae bacterium]
MVTLHRLVVAAPASGHGKTTVATGLMAALARRGLAVSGHKVGPDYIDPGYHALATGRPGRNLDPHLVGEERLVPLLLHGARGADVAVVEGVMGLYDGQLGGDGYASTAHVAAVTRTPVVLVVDICHASRTIAATVHGLATWSPDVQIVGVILNKAGSDRHAAEVVRALGDRLPILGVLRRDDGIEAPSRHLGLVPAAERPEAAAALDRLAAQVAERVDLDEVLRLARTAPALAGEAWSAPAAEPIGTRPVIAVAGGRAFTFAYAETTELLAAAGCEVVTFDPTTDESLPEGTRGLYLGGGFPELHAASLSGNESLRAQLRSSITAGLPTVAECAGLLYLCRTVDGAPMVGAIDADAAMAPRLTLAYRTATATADDLLSRQGETVTGHEFHRTHLLAEPGPAPWDTGGGLATPTLHASYLHTHWAGHPHLAARFAAAAAAARPAPRPAPRTAPGAYTSLRMSPVGLVGRAAVTPATFAGPGTHAAATDALRHHGDREATDGLVDFAVNVFEGPRPDWLERALAQADVGRYPDRAPAIVALAEYHDRPEDEVLPTAGAAEAFGLVARLRAWRRPVVVHPQFTEPDVALAAAGHRPEHVILRADDGFALDPTLVPSDADLVIVGNPTNPTGVRHRAESVHELRREGRLLVVDEAFLDDGDQATSAGADVVVLRSLTKLWGIPGVRAGYLLGDAATVAGLRDLQTPWSVSAAAIAALVACHTPEAEVERKRRTEEIAEHRAYLETRLADIGFATSSTAPFVLIRTAPHVHEALRKRGFAVRRADTFPGLGPGWLRIAVRGPEKTDALVDALRGTIRETG